MIFVIHARPLNPAEKRAFRKLLKEADAFAKRHGMSRSQLIAQGVRAVIGHAA